MTIYGVGDIHGQRALLDEVLERIERDGGPEAEVVFVGDYIDRGPDSRGVIDRLIEGVAAGRKWTCLMGNHDRMFATFLQTGSVDFTQIKSALPWTHRRLGGLATLESYGIDVTGERSADALWQDAREAVPEAHLDFLLGLSPYAERPGLLFVHAGIRPGVALADQVEDDLIWIREPFLSHPDPHPWLVVHGHTQVETAEHRGNRVNLDGGAGYGRPLCAVAFEEGEVFALTPRGRVPLLP